MTLTQRRRIEEMLVAAMTSGLTQKGPEYRLPESLAIEYGRICYNMAVEDMIKLVRALDAGADLCEKISDFHLTRKVTL